MRKVFIPVFIFVAISLCGKNVLPDSLKKSQKTFKVADVVPAVQPLNDTGFKMVIENRIGKKTFAIYQPPNTKRIVPVNMHGFVETVQFSFDQHRPLVISPDMIWLLICQGFSIHVNEHFERYKGQLFTNEKTKEIIVREDSLNAASEKDRIKGWKYLMNQFSDTVKVFCKEDIHSLMVSNFSTTGPAEKSVYEITLLETAKKAFSYQGETGCGIPEITLKGTTADWKKIYTNVDGFKKYGLTDWVESLKPVLQEFVNASQGKINKDFWNSLYKVSEGYGRFHISGWIIKFFPYIKDYYFLENFNWETAAEGTPNQSFRYVNNEFYRGEDYRLSNLSTENFPSGFAKIDVKWTNYYSQEPQPKMMEVYGGFLGILQNKKTLALEPLITWAVCEKEAPARNYDIGSSHYDRETKHKADYWLSKVNPEPGQLPIYHPEKNKTYEEGIEELKTYLQEKIKPKQPVTIEFIVTWGGTITKIKHHMKATDAFTRAQKTLKNLPFTWKPASTRLIDQFSESGEEVDYKENYKVILEIK